MQGLSNNYRMYNIKDNKNRAGVLEMKLWKNKIVDIYITKEVLIPYITGVAIITVIGLSNFLFQLTDLIINKNIAMPIVLKLLLYQLPDIIVQTFPIAVLFATISGMSRLNRENEFTALRLGGISIYRLILPLVILGLLISSLTFFINEEVVPWTNHEAQNIIRINILKQAKPDVEDNVFFKGPEGRLFYVSKFDQAENTLEKVVVYELPEGDGEFPEIITAQSGKILGIDGDQGSKWRLEGGIIHRYTNNGRLHQAVMFDSMEYEITNEIDNFFGEQRTTSEMNRENLKKNIDLFQRSGIKVNDLLIDYHLKLTMPLSALIFILIGTPLSLSSKDSRSSSMILTIIIVFAYYLILSLSRSFGKNGAVPPLLAAWIPNMFFGLIGIALLIWREKWQNWAARFVPFLGLVVFLAFFINPVNTVKADTLNVYKAEQLSYNQEKGKYELTGEIVGQYTHYHIFADTVTIKMEDGSEKEYPQVEEINMQKSKFTGCDLDSPHYYFDASEVIIYPGDHLIAKHATFRELNGKLPLFYWPYLYISLKDKDQRLVPEIGYSNSRGWFLRTTYYYWYKNRLPGELYMDYYTRSGSAGGFKQYVFYESDLEAFFYLYGQENRTDIPGLFNWQAEIDIDNDKSEWKTDTNIRYTDYDNYAYLRGSIDLDNYADSWSLNVDSTFNSKDYFTSDENDDKDIAFDLNFNKEFNYNWKYHLDLYRDYKYNNEDGLKQRWGGKTYISRDTGNLDYRMTYERRAPSYTKEDDEEDKVTYYRWPELELNYNPGGLLDYNFQLGNYYEDSSKVEGLRGHGKVNYNKSWRLTDDIRYTTDHDLIGRVYKVKDDGSDYNHYTGMTETVYDLPYQLSYNNTNTLRMSVLPGLTWTNKYSYSEYRGQSPFTFDNARNKEMINTNLNYTKLGLRVALATAYDIYEQSYSPITATSRWHIMKDWSLSLGTSYNIETGIFGDFYITNRYKDDIWQINNGLRYDVNNSLVKKLDTRIVYDYNDEWHIELNNIYDNQEKNFDTANIALKKVFHCRSITFSYDYVKEEYSFEYNINLFPDQKIKVGSSEEDSFMFDVGIDELIKEEG